MNKFDQIHKDIKNLKIQGAHHVALAGLRALKYKKNYKKIISARPTEPALRNAITFSKITDLDAAKNYLNDSQNKIIGYGTSLINGNIFTHCHSSSVTKVLINAKKQRKKFQVFSTETRPKYQGRKTALELTKNQIKVTHFVDSAANEYIKNSDLILLGADMITPKGEVANKIGSNLIAELAKIHKVPVYILTSAWKYSPKKLKIEQRNKKEVWEKQNKYLDIKNPAFEIIEPKLIKGIVSELGILKPKQFLKKVKKIYPWIK